MKIKDLGKKSSVKKTSSSGNASSAKNVSNAGNSQSAQASGKAGVSVTGTDQISASLSSASSARADKVASVKLEVDSGTYQADSQKTAEKIVDSLTDYSLA